MASDFFARIDGIRGESQDAHHKDEIQFVAWSWGVSHGAVAGGAGAGARPSFSDFSLTKIIDQASPKLFEACAKGQHISQAKMTVRDAGAGQQEFLIITMNDVSITDVHQTCSTDDGGLVESVSMRCAKVKFEYKPQKVDGSLGAGVIFNFDVKANKAA